MRTKCPGLKEHPKLPWREGLVSQRRWSLKVQKKFFVLTGGGIQKTTWTEAKDPDKARESRPLGVTLTAANRMSNASSRLAMVH